MGDVDLPALLVALTGLGALVVGHITNRKGQRAQDAQSKVAKTLEGQAQEFTQQGAIIDRLEAELERTDRVHREELARREAEYRAALEACVEARAELAATVALLAETLRDEVARSMAEMALADSAKHTTERHTGDD